MYLVQCSIHHTNAIRHLSAFWDRQALGDESLVVKPILTEGLSGAVVRPWSIHTQSGPLLKHTQRGPLFTVLGYSELGPEELKDRLCLALPTVQKAIPELLALEMPQLGKGNRYRFGIRLVPTIRVTKSPDRRYGERDAFLVAVEKFGPDAGLVRDEIYRTYLADRLKGAEIDGCRMGQFRLVDFVRPKAGGGFARKKMPEATLEGALTVTDGAAFQQVVTSGIGRQRAYGYGMIRLQPAPALNPGGEI